MVESGRVSAAQSFPCAADLNSLRVRKTRPSRTIEPSNRSSFHFSPKPMNGICPPGPHTTASLRRDEVGRKSPKRRSPLTRLMRSLPWARQTLPKLACAAILGSVLLLFSSVRTSRRFAPPPVSSRLRSGKPEYCGAPLGGAEGLHGWSHQFVSKNEPKLRMLQVLVRHGDRSPIHALASPPPSFDVTLTDAAATEVGEEEVPIFFLLPPFPLPHPFPPLPDKDPADLIEMAGFCCSGRRQSASLGTRLWARRGGLHPVTCTPSPPTRPPPAPPPPRGWGSSRRRASSSTWRWAGEQRGGAREWCSHRRRVPERVARTLPLSAQISQGPLPLPEPHDGPVDLLQDDFLSQDFSEVRHPPRPLWPKLKPGKRRSTHLLCVPVPFSGGALLLSLAPELEGPITVHVHEDNNKEVRRLV